VRDRKGRESPAELEIRYRCLRIQTAKGKKKRELRTKSVGTNQAVNLVSGSDSVMGAWSFGYDNLNHLEFAQNTGTTSTSQQYANRQSFF
jgi:hypothetical protein